MLNKNMLLLSGTVAAVSVIGTIGVSKAIKGINKITEKKKKENAFFNILKECIEEEIDYYIASGIINQSDRESVVKQIFEDIKEFVKDSKEEDRNSIFNMPPEEQKRHLTESIKNSRVLYAMNGLFA